jgi:hypothetical protein
MAAQFQRMWPSSIAAAATLCAALFISGCGNEVEAQGAPPATSSHSDGGTDAELGADAAPNPSCNQAIDCTGPVSECRGNVCEAGKCGYVLTASGTPLSEQMAGDCRRLVCSGTGSEASEADTADVYDDGRECTHDLCTDQGPRNEPVAAGTACGVTGQEKCDGAGLCAECVADADCPGELCVLNTCVPRACTDEVKNGAETDVDCGGPECVACDSGRTCALASDCKTGICTGSLCEVGQCEDDVKNGGETDVDCGGPECPGCGPLRGCLADADCAGLKCSGSTCLPSCSDGVRNVNETGVDCGGPDCPACPADVLSTATGCQGVFNTNQILDYKLTISASDWQALKADTTNSRFFPATLACGDTAGIQVGVRRKRSGGTDKPGIKIDINYYALGQYYYGLKKLSFENGISEGSGTVDVYDVLTEYLSWRIMQHSGMIAGRAAFAKLYVNGSLVGVYVNVEQVDKAFLASRVGDDSGWLYKHSGSASDGYKTNETRPNPYEAAMCFWEKNGCPVPTNLESYLPVHLNIEQMLLMGGVNAIIANQDAPLIKENNYIFYDYASGPRLYFPWDLDTTQKTSQTIFNWPGTTMYRDVLFAHWEDDYDILLTSVLQGPLALSVIVGEINRAVSVAGTALDADPNVAGSGAAAAATQLKSYWRTRHPQLVTELAAHAP